MAEKQKPADWWQLQIYAEGLPVPELRRLAQGVGMRYVWESRKSELVENLVLNGLDLLRQHRAGEAS